MHPKLNPAEKYSSGLQRGEVNVSAEDERDMEMSVFLPTACYALCQPLENADAPSTHHRFFPPHAFFFITQGKLKTVKRKQKQHHDGGCRRQCRADLIFKVPKLKRGRAEPWLVYYLYNFKLLLCAATPEKNPLNTEWLEGTGSKQSCLLVP